MSDGKTKYSYEHKREAVELTRREDQWHVSLATGLVGTFPFLLAPVLGSQSTHHRPDGII
jgi:hypothetical protein